MSNTDDADQHEGKSDFYVIVGGTGEMVTDGEIVNRQFGRVPSTFEGPTAYVSPHEFNGQPVEGGHTYQMRPGDWLVVPPNVVHWPGYSPGEGLMYGLVGVQIGTYPNNLGFGAKAPRPPASSRNAPIESPPVWRTTIPAPSLGGDSRFLWPNQPEQATYWSIEDIRKSHQLLADAEREKRALDPNSTLHDFPYWTRTHSMSLRHIPEGRSGKTAEQHLGYAQFIVVTGGTGAVVLGGEIPSAVVLQEGGRQVFGELRGETIMNGDTFALGEGDWLSIPPDTPSQFLTDAPGGLTYMVMKINAMLYPWELTR